MTTGQAGPAIYPAVVEWSLAGAEGDTSLMWRISFLPRVLASSWVPCGTIATRASTETTPSADLCRHEPT